MATWRNLSKSLVQHKNINMLIHSIAVTYILTKQLSGKLSGISRSELLECSLTLQWFIYFYLLVASFNYIEVETWDI